MKSRPTAGLAAGVLSVLAFATPALAAPVTVDLRIEGRTTTLFEGPVTTDVRTFRFTDNPMEYTCDGTDASGGSSPTPQPTRGAVITQASLATPFSTRGTFSARFKSPSFDEVAGEDVRFDPDTGRFLGEFENGQFASVGSCADTVQSGDKVLYAYTDGNEPLLALAGPATAKPGDTVELTVSDAGDRSAVAGATVGGQTTDSAGKARVVVSERGPNAFKATKTGTVRSNATSVCVTDGQDGFCGTTKPGAQPTTGQPAPTSTTPPASSRDVQAPEGRFLGIREQQVFSASQAPREFAVEANDPSGIELVKLRLRRSNGGTCSYFSGRQERFRRTRCGRGAYFKASTVGNFSYLLPAKLGPGRYVLDVVAIDKAFNRDRLARGRSRVVFFVR